jgi:hypothetical protein
VHQSNGGNSLIPTVYLITLLRSMPIQIARRSLVTILLVASQLSGARAQTVWIGGTASNDMTNGANWQGGTVNLNSTSTALSFGDAGATYTPTPFLPAGSYQIGTLTIANATTPTLPLFIDHGSGVITSSVIDGLNIATSINYNTSAAVQLKGSIDLGSGATVGGTGTNFLALGSAPTGGGAGVIASNGPITMNGSGFELRLDGDASHLGTVNLSQGFLAVTPNGTGFQSNVVSGAGTPERPWPLKAHCNSGPTTCCRVPPP